MTIQLHCEHCGKLIQASESVGGRSGKCPHCQGMNYIPLPAKGEGGELPLAPLDEEFERHRRQAVAEDMDVQRRLWHEQDSSRKTDRHGSVRQTDADLAPPPKHSRKQLTALVVSFIEAMSRGDLEKADGLIAQLANQKAEVFQVLDELVSDDLNTYGLPVLPRPVLVGFMKQLRSKL